MLSRFNPAVPRRWLFAIAGLVWTTAGLILCTRGFSWLTSFSVAGITIFESLGIVIAITGYYFGFSKIVVRNVARIHRLPASVCLFAFTAWRGYMMIAIMVTIGVTLRNSDIPKYYLSVPYTSMGGALLIGSFGFYREFLNDGREGN